MTLRWPVIGPDTSLDLFGLIDPRVDSFVFVKRLVFARSYRHQDK